MAITVQEDGKLFTIQTANTTYQMMADRYGVLLHLYYGRKAGGSMEYLLTYSDRGYCANINDAGRDRTYSLDFLPQEFPVSGTGDMRSPALIAEYGNGILMIAACVLIVLIYLFPTMAAFEAPVKTLIGNRNPGGNAETRYVSANFGSGSRQNDEIKN